MASPPKPEFVIQSDKISSVSFLPEIQSILLSSSDGKVSFFSFDSQRLVCEFKTDEEDLLIVGGFFVDDKKYDSKDNNKTDIEDKEILLSEKHVWFPRIRIVCHFKSGNIVLYRIQNNKLDIENAWKAARYCFAKLFFNPQDKTFGFLSGENTNTSFNIVDTQRLSNEMLKLSFDGTNHGVITSSFYWSESESMFLIFGDETGSLTLYEHKTGAWNFLVKKSSLKLFEEIVLSFDFHPKSGIGVAGSMSNEIILWSLSNSSNTMELKQTKRISLSNSSITSCAIREDGRIFSVSDKNGQFRILSLKTGKALAAIPFHTADIRAMVFNKIDNKFLLFIADNHTLMSVWSLFQLNKESNN